MDGTGQAIRLEPEVVGRDAELAKIDDLTAAAPDGLRALLIQGEPGIGKTTLWRYGVRRLLDRGWRVLESRAVEEEMPFGAVALADLFDETALDSSSDDDAMTRGRAVLAQVLALVDDGPTAIAIDDIQWLDHSSSRSLRFALRRLVDVPLIVLTTMRTGHSHGDPLALGATVMPERFEMIGLGPLDLRSLRAVLASTVTKISKPTLRVISEASGGNPGYAIELARVFGPRVMSVDVAELPLPGSLQDAIAERLDDAPDALTPLLELMAARGRSNVGELAAAIDRDDVGDLIREAERLELVVTDGSGRVRFAHPLIRSAAYGRMGLSGRRGLHARLAIEATTDDERARHLALSIERHDPDVAAELEAASVRAAERGAHDLAAEFAAHSWRTTPTEREDDLRRRALLRIVALTSAGEVTRAREELDELVERLPAGPGRAEVLIERVFVDDDDPATTEASLTQALEEAGRDEALRANVLDVLGWRLAIFRGDLGEGLRHEREAVEIADRLGDAELQMLTKTGLAVMEALSGRPRADWLQQSIEIGQEIGAPPQWAGPRVWLAKQLLWEGDLAEAGTRFRALYEESLSGGKEFRRAFALYDLALLACVAGDLDDAVRFEREGIEAARDAEDGFAEWWLQYPIALTDALRGDLEGARGAATRLLERSLPRGERPTVVRAKGVLGSLALSVGDPSGAKAELEVACDLLEEMGIRHPGAFPVVPDAIEALVRVGELDTAERRLRTLQDQVEGCGRWAGAAATRSNAWLLLGRDDAGAAARAFEDAAHEFDLLGCRPDAARSILGRGRALLQEGRRTAAADSFVDARDRFASFPAALWEAQATAELERVAPGRSTGELTPTERRIAALVAEGERNREIADALFMAVATVEAHLTRTYRKLGIRSRTELTALVLSGDIDTTSVEPPQAS